MSEGEIKAVATAPQQQQKSQEDEGKLSNQDAVKEEHQTMGVIAQWALGRRYVKIKDHVRKCFMSVEVKYVRRTEFLSTAKLYGVTKKANASKLEEEQARPDELISSTDCIVLVETLLGMSTSNKPDARKAIVSICDRCPSLSVKKEALFEKFQSNPELLCIDEQSYLDALKGDETFSDVEHVPYSRLKPHVYSWLVYCKHKKTLREEFDNMEKKHGKDCVPFIPFYEETSVSDVFGMYSNIQEVDNFNNKYLDYKRQQHIVRKLDSKYDAKADVITREMLENIITAITPAYNSAKIPKTRPAPSESQSHIDKKAWKIGLADAVKNIQTNVLHEARQTSYACVNDVSFALNGDDEKSKKDHVDAILTKLQYKTDDFETISTTLVEKLLKPHTTYYKLASECMKATCPEHWTYVQDLVASKEHPRLCFALMHAAIYRRIHVHVTDNRDHFAVAQLKMDDLHDFGDDEILKTLLRRGQAFDRYDAYVMAYALCLLDAEGKLRHSTLEPVFVVKVGSIESSVLFDSVIKSLLAPFSEFASHLKDPDFTVTPDSGLLRGFAGKSMPTYVSILTFKCDPIIARRNNNSNNKKTAPRNRVNRCYGLEGGKHGKTGGV